MIFEEIKNVRDKLTDEKSVKIFDARFQYAFDRDWNLFFENIRNSFSGEFYCVDFKKFMDDKTGKKIVIYGAGMMGKYAANLLEAIGFTIYAYGDSKKFFNNDGRIIVLSDMELLKQKEELVFVIGSSRYALEIYDKLLGYGINRNNIYYPRFGYLFGTCGSQYFDFFQPVEGETFVDAGAYNGDTSIEFANWNPKYGKIYMLEANPQNKDAIVNRLQNAGVDKYELIMKGLSNKNKTGGLCGSMDGSHVSDSGNITIELTCIDEIFKEGRENLFIKMDIEGEEANAIIGATKILQRFKPRLAISIYHKMDDFYTIPSLLSKINPDYLFAIRHYTSTPYETVLYAW